MEATRTLYCRCGVPITRALRPTTRLLQLADGQPLVPAGEIYEIGEGWDELSLAQPGDFLVDKRDLSGCHDGGDRQGCCGPSGNGGPTVFCPAEHDVATELADCWLPHVVVVHRDRVRTEQPHWIR